jgi:hypothetical protein
LIFAAPIIPADCWEEAFGSHAVTVIAINDLGRIPVARSHAIASDVKKSAAQTLFIVHRSSFRSSSVIFPANAIGTSFAVAAPVAPAAPVVPAFADGAAVTSARAPVSMAVSKTAT